MADINRFLSDAVESGKVPAIEGVVKDGDGVLYHEVFGWRNVATTTPLQKGDLFRIASMTKAITSTAVMILYDEGRLDLDDPASRCLPALGEVGVLTDFDAADTAFATVPPANAVTIRQLLDNTAGIAYPWWDERLPMIAAKLGERFPADEVYLRIPLLHEPGTRRTCGPSTRALGEIITAITGKELYTFLEDRIFAPLNMGDILYTVPEDKLDRRVTRHVKANGRFIEQPLEETRVRTAVGDAGLTSSAADYARFLRMLLRGGEFDGTRIVSERLVELMTGNRIGDLRLRALFRGLPAEAERDKFGFSFQITTRRLGCSSNVPKAATAGRAATIPFSGSTGSRA